MTTVAAVAGARDDSAGTGEIAGTADSAESLLRRAIGAQEKGEHARAAGLFQRAIEAEPRSWIAHTCLGNTLRALKRLDEAIAAQRRAVELSADHRALSNLALSYRDAGRLDDAIAALDQAIALAPGAAELHQNLSGLLLEADRPDRATLAEAAARRALALDPRQARAETNLGCALKELGDRGQAEGSFRRAIALDAGNADAHWNLGLTLLGAARSIEEEVEGWREIEWRQRIPGLRTPPPASGDAASRPLWRGEPLHGRTLLLQAEQGLGDTLQLVRYARQVKAAAGAGRVVIECQPPLRRLLAGCDGADLVVAAARGAGPSPSPSPSPVSAAARPFPSFDVRAPLFSVPALLGGRAMDGGPDTPYLRADPERIRRWGAIIAARAAERLHSLGRPSPRARAPFTIGIAWQGNPRYRADRRRSIPLAHFAPLFEAAARLGACVFTLQKGDGREQLAALPATAPVDDLAAELDLEADAGADAGAAFLDTAAAMCALDLVITSDTAIPHLGGALGRPVWLLLSHLPDWRWGQAGQRCRWYRRTRLFRQERPDDWAGVFARVTCALSEAIGP